MTNIRLLGSIAFKGVLEEYENRANKESDAISCTYFWGPTGTVFERCRSGESYDVLIGLPDALDTMIAEGYAVPGSRMDIAKSLIGVAVKAGAARPKISTVGDFKAALAAAKSVAYTDPTLQAPSGLHIAKLLDDWGMTEEINAKTRFGDGGAVAKFLLTGEAELALQQISELMLVKGVDLAGPLPAEIQLVSTMSVAIGSRSWNPVDAKSLIAWLSHSTTHPILRRHGLFALRDI